MTPRSISRRLIGGVLILELVSALSLVAITALHESRIRYRAFDVTLRARADALVGAVADDEEPGDNLTLDPAVKVPSRIIFEVKDEETGRILGHSKLSPTSVLKIAETSKDSVFKFTLDGNNYRLVRSQGLRTVDAGQPGGGFLHHVTVLCGAPTRGVSKDVLDTVRFYTLASFILLAVTGCGMALFLRYQLEPLDALADEAAKVSTRKWQFNPPESARATIELAPLTLAIETTLARLRESFEQQERFTSDAAHELKTGVAIAKSSLQLLAMRTRSVEEYKHGLEICLKDCLRLESTVQEMLALARVQHASVADVSSPAQIVDIADCAREAVGKFESFAELRRVTVTVSATGSTNARLTSEDANHLCSNLLLNALQHSGPGSEVLLEISTGNGWLNMSIQDQGGGIASDILPHVFEPFFRGDPSRSRNSGGTGLGLSICKAICDRAGGNIAIESTVGTGTRVMVRIPAASAPSDVHAAIETKTHSARINTPHANVERY